MTDYAGPLYETSFVVSDDALSELDSWLEEVIKAASRKEGIEAARAFDSGVDDQGRSIRTCQFQAQDDNALDVLIDGYFGDIDAAAADKFGDRVIVQSRALRADHSYELPPNESPVCLNCGTRLRGQYCGSCGQRSRSRLISIWQLLKEAFGDLLELDSRLWRTALPLLIRPGQLTRDYLEGRRARYMPPFRTYLVLSVIFFVVAFFDPTDNLGLLFEPEPEPTAEEIVGLEEEAKITATENKEQLDAALEKLRKLEADGVISENTAAEFEEVGDGLRISFDSDTDPDGGIFGNCEDASISDEDDVPEWVSKRFTDERVKQICERNKARGNDNFADAIVDNVPLALIVLLPLMAMVLKLLYPLSRRYFVEHLLFFVHFHAFFFLILILQILFERLLASLSLDGTISTLILVATSFYIPVYLYKAMRRVYGQGHLMTILKYLMLLTAYLSGATLTLLGAFLVALLSA